ncbi:hypothetical protein [Rudaeicoccus suwonensis]|uniref:Uncharacterized protein n=1 Tax=Rudaeicoccus suwonensis TaxID=657409 RepID=A0A561ECD1_9MICO|nr:hypothetical protein [Rudaeicoccus suwonensis]TWE13262.1 hypothetical protein BKA23_2091 [Rudaeicoccus suwonensis]
MCREREQCPGRETEALQSVSSGDFKLSSTIAEADLIARAKRHDYAIRVVFERADGRVCSQMYADLSAAERKQVRCHERGLQATLTLVRLVPVHHVTADLLALVDGGDCVA